MEKPEVQVDSIYWLDYGVQSRLVQVDELVGDVVNFSDYADPSLDRAGALPLAQFRNMMTAELAVVWLTD